MGSTSVASLGLVRTARSGRPARARQQGYRSSVLPPYCAGISDQSRCIRACSCAMLRGRQIKFVEVADRFLDDGSIDVSFERQIEPARSDRAPHQRPPARWLPKIGASVTLGWETAGISTEVALERELGIQAGLAWAQSAQASIVYTDRGISAGMRTGIARAQEIGRPVEYRRLVRPAHDAAWRQGEPR